MAHQMRVSIVESTAAPHLRGAYHGWYHRGCQGIGHRPGGDLTEIGSLISSADRGDAGAAEALFTALYAELHRMARRELARSVYATLGTTTLLHEAYLDVSSRAAPCFRIARGSWPTPRV
jgi:hypothetical protein